MRDYPKISRRITFTLFLAQSIFSAGLIGIFTVSAIVGKELSGKTAWAGIPLAVYQVIAALSAFGWGYFMARRGRRAGLVMGLALGAVGIGVAGAAVINGSFLVFLLGMMFMGTAQSAMGLGRFAAAEVHPPEGRGRAIASVVLGGTVGSILGPLLVGPSGRLAKGAGVNELAGPFGVALVLYILAVVVIFIWLRPEPIVIARELAEQNPTAGQTAEEARAIPLILRQPAVVVAMTAMVVGQMVMGMVMGITSLHMKNYGHNLGDISLVISSHTFGMFAFSILSGRLVDRWGRGPVILTGAATLVVACLAATLSTAVLPLAAALFLLGLGWNFCFVGGSTLLADQLSPAEQSRTQGFNDLLIGFASATAGFSGGFVLAAVGYNSMALAGAAVSLIPLLLTFGWQRRQRMAASASD